MQPCRPLPQKKRIRMGKAVLTVLLIPLRLAVNLWIVCTPGASDNLMINPGPKS